LKHEEIQKRALNSSEDDEICLPWKRLVQWEKDWWYKTKNLVAQSPKENEPNNPPWSLKNFQENLEFLSALGGKTSQSEKPVIPKLLLKNKNTPCPSSGKISADEAGLLKEK